MNDQQQVAPWRRSGFRDLFGANGDSPDFDEMPSASDSTAGFVSLGFIGSALRRRMPVWLAVTVIGLFVGVGVVVLHPPSHSATTTVLLDTGTDTQGTELKSDIEIVQSIPVAAAVVAQLKIPQTPLKFLATYTAAVVGKSTQILMITASGPSDDAAVQRASVIAQQFLAYRAKYLQNKLQQATNSLNRQVSQAQQHLNAINQQISTGSTGSSGASQPTQVEKADAQRALSLAQQNATSTQLQDQATTAQMVQGSQVLSAATAVPRSIPKVLALALGGGLIGGLLVGMAIVVIGAITTDKVRRRDDIAIAVGAPVRLSVGPLRRRRLLPESRENSGRRNRDMKLVAEHLRNALPAGSKVTTALAVVAADDAPTVAQAVIELALTSSQQRKRVVLADLSAGAPAARLLGVTTPGMDTVSPEGVPILVVVPEPEDVAPVGPLTDSSPESSQVNERLADAFARADLVLSLVTLSPAFGGDYLRTWATDAVIVVTAGQSTATRLHATGEMVRLAGTRLRSVVVLGADKEDESLGTVTAAFQPSSAVEA